MSRTGGLRSETQKKIAPRLFSGAIVLNENQIKSGALLRSTHIFALRFELRELLSGKDSFRMGQKRLTAVFCATRLHTFGLPRLDLALLIRREIQWCQINACRRVYVRGAFGAACLVTCKRAGSQHPSRN